MRILWLSFRLKMILIIVEKYRPTNKMLRMAMIRHIQASHPIIFSALFPWMSREDKRSFCCNSECCTLEVDVEIVCRIPESGQMERRTRTTHWSKGSAYTFWPLSSSSLVSFRSSADTTSRKDLNRWNSLQST